MCRFECQTYPSRRLASRLLRSEGRLTRWMAWGKDPRRDVTRGAAAKRAERGGSRQHRVAVFQKQCATPAPVHPLRLHEEMGCRAPYWSQRNEAAAQG